MLKLFADFYTFDRNCWVHETPNCNDDVIKFQKVEEYFDPLVTASVRYFHPVTGHVQCLV